jgi:hypothetical protein
VNVSPSTTRSGRARIARFGPLTLALAVAAVLLLFGSACGGSSSAQGVAQVDSIETTTTDTTSAQDSADGSSSADPAAFSACMRAHGLPKFPDPDRDGQIRFRGPVDPESPQFRTARRACRELEPEESAPSPAEQAEDRAQLLRFSACMRAQGLSKLPDPDPSGGISIGKNSGFAPDSRQFKAAEKACRNFLPGAGGSANGPVGTP